MLKGFEVITSKSIESVKLRLTLIRDKHNRLFYVSTAMSRLIGESRFVTALYNADEKRVVLQFTANKVADSRCLSGSEKSKSHFSHAGLGKILAKHGKSWELKPLDEDGYFEVMLHGEDTAR